MAKTILVIEDEPDLAAGLKANLEIEGHSVVVAHSGEEGLRRAFDASPDLVVLDLMLPGMSGYDALRELRSRGSNVPVLILSARSEEVDKVRGFRTGADDYVAKPFGVMELMLRVQALLRRAAGKEAAALPTVEQIGDARVDLERRVVMRNGGEESVTPRAIALLTALLQKRERVVSRQELLRDVWGYSVGVTTRTVDAHIAELRRKIERDPTNPQHILTVWKTGYRLRL